MYQNRLRSARAKPVHATVHELVLRARFEADFGHLQPCPNLLEKNLLHQRQHLQPCPIFFFLRKIDSGALNRVQNDPSDAVKTPPSMFMTGGGVDRAQNDPSDVLNTAQNDPSNAEKAPN